MHSYIKYAYFSHALFVHVYTYRIVIGVHLFHTEIYCCKTVRTIYFIA